MPANDPTPARKPAIIAPMMRYLGVSDIARSLAFYRDVLGFDVRETQDENGVVEVLHGPARIRFGAQDRATDDPQQLRPPGSAILFFETDDVAAMHTAVRSRGGVTTELEKVNWIKMQMFEIRDPEGHTLWFGQSYNQPDQPAPRHLLSRIMPELPLDDLAAGVAHYRDVLGFRINYQQHDLGVMDRDNVRLLLILRTDRHKGIGSAYVYVEDADALHAELLAKGAKIQGEPVSQPWGLRDFRVLDLEGNQITFGQPFE